MNKYLIEFELNGLPKTTNSLARAHWRTKHNHTLSWQRAVWAKVWPLRPKVPFKVATLTLTRFSSVQCDYDGLVSSFKCLVDGLVEAKILANDKMSNIGVPTYLWEQAPKGKGKVRIKVEATVP